MDSSIKQPEFEHNGFDDSTTRINPEKVGSIAKRIGTGKNAKDSFIWMTITWSFIIAAGLSILIFIRSFFEVAKGENLLDCIANVWGVFVPIITLALGYAFGKGE
jgi:hypothetical protein